MCKVIPFNKRQIEIEVFELKDDVECALGLPIDSEQLEDNIFFEDSEEKELYKELLDSTAIDLCVKFDYSYNDIAEYLSTTYGVPIEY